MSNPTTGCRYKVNTTGQDSNKEWYGDDPLVCGATPFITIEWLLENDILNVPSGDTSIDTDFVPRTFASKQANVGLADKKPIHPVFRYRKDHWKNITETDYNAYLKPVLRLASCFLDDPLIIPFFTDLIARPLRDLGDLKAQAKFAAQTPRLYTFGRHTASLNGTSEAMNAWRTMANMAACVRWEFRGDITHVMEQAEDANLPGLAGPNSAGSVVYVSRHYLAVLQKQVKASDFKDVPQAAKNDHALLRTQWHMAKTFVHEFCHCLNTALFQRDDTQTMIELFHFNDRTAEIGCAFEQTMFDGWTIVVGNDPQGPRHAAAAYGLVKVQFPGTIRGIGQERCSPAKHADRTRNPGAVDAVSSFVQMQFVHRYFTKVFWEMQVPRSSSVEVFHIPDGPESMTETSDEPDAGESPLTLKRAASDSPASGPAKVPKTGLRGDGSSH